MTAREALALLPLMLIAAAAVAVLLASAFGRSTRAAWRLAVAGLAAALAALAASPGEPTPVMSLVLVDGPARFLLGVLVASALAVSLLAHGYLQAREAVPDEFHLLLLLATLGAAILAVSDHFASLFLGLELLSVSLYALIAYPRSRLACIEAGLKYLVLAASASAFLVFGMALVYAETGAVAFDRLAAWGGGGTPVLLSGWGMVAVGIAFKLALVPFHLWAPDVYQGAPAPVTAFVATVSKGAVVALLVRLDARAAIQESGALTQAFGAMAAASMIAGTVLALLQTSVKRLLAYSSIAHLGILLVAFLARGGAGTAAVLFYLAAYCLTTLIAFGAVAVLSAAGPEADRFDDYRGLFWRRPWLAGSFTAALLSLAGIPLTAGFVGKVVVALAGVNASLWTLVVILAVSSAVSFYYYLRLVAVIFDPAPAEAAPLPAARGAAADAGTMAALTLGLIWLGVDPAPLLRVIQATLERI